MLLPDGLVLRRATEADADQILELSVEAHGAQEETAVRWMLEREDVGPGAWVVVTDGDRVVSTSVGLHATYRLGGTDLPLGQVEYVASLPDYRNRGIVRAIFADLEREASDRGALFHLVEGIPYFYRVLDYGYGLSYPSMRDITPDAVAPVPDLLVADAVEADLPDMQLLHDTAQGRCDLVRPWAPEEWKSFLRVVPSKHEAVLVARRGAEVRAWARLIHYDDFGYDLSHGAAADEASARALMAEALRRAAGERVAATPRSRDPYGEAVERLGRPFPWFEGRYVKIPDALAFLERIRPHLDERLRQSTFAAHTGDLVISLYRRAIVLRIVEGAIAAIEWGPGRLDPLEENAVGVPPEWLPALLLGRFSPTELEARVDDVTLTPFAELVEVLFPALVADVEWLL